MALTGYDKGFRDGYLEGLEECGPITGLTRFFDRRGKRKKLSTMKDEERIALIAEAMAEYEGEARQAKQRILKNPGASHHKMVAEMKRNQAKTWMKKALASRDPKDRFVYAVGAFQAASHAFANDLSQESNRLQTETARTLGKVAKVPPDYLMGLVENPKKRRKPAKRSRPRKKTAKKNPRKAKKTTSVRSLVSRALK